MTATVREVKYAPDRELIELPEEEQKIIQSKLNALQKLLADDQIKAKYKLEVLFGKARSTWKPTSGALTFWENGSKFHGGGDAKIYLCPGKLTGRNECSSPIPDFANTSNTLICPKCGIAWPCEKVIGELFFNLPMRKWAEVLYDYFRKFDCHCDIYLKHAPDDIRSISLAQRDKPTFRGSELLDKTRAKRARHIYPLRNILKDVSAGADVLGRFYAFLVA